MSLHDRSISPILHDHDRHHKKVTLEALHLPSVSDLTAVAPSPIEESELLLPTYEKSVDADADDRQEEEEYENIVRERIGLWRHYLFKVHKYSSFTFSGFLALHFATVAVTPGVFGIEAGDNAMLLARVLYQTPGVEETVVFGSLAAHVVSGVMLRVHKIRRDRKWYSRRMKMSRVSFSGYLLFPLVASHVFLVRVIPRMCEGDSSLVTLRYVSHGFARSRLVSWTFYAAFICGSAYHVGYGFARWMRVRRLTFVRLAQVACAGLGLLGVGVIARAGTAGWIAKKYDGMYDVVDRILGFKV